MTNKSILFAFEPKNHKIRPQNSKLIVQNRHKVDVTYPTVNKRKKGKQSHWNNLIRFSKKFFNDTTIGGLRQILGHKPLNKYARFLWALMWMAMVAASCTLCFNSTRKYWKYDVKDSLQYETLKSINFPAITFCNQNMFKKSAVGGSFAIMLALASTSSTDSKEIKRIALENNRSCFTPTKSDLAKQFEIESFNLFLKIGVKKLMHMASMGSDVGVLKCWWKNYEVNCSDLFLNHLTALNWCFTFNPSKQYLFDEDPEVVGLTSRNYAKHELNNFGERSGLKLLLNVNHSEYCAGAGKYFKSSGYIVKLHDPKVQPRMNIDKQLSFSAGYAYDVVIRPVMFRKKTETLGRCLMNMNLMLYPNITYFRQSCIYEEYTKIIWNKCKCYVIVFDGMQDLLAEFLQVSVKNLSVCWNEKLVCVSKIDNYYLNSPIEQVFPRCKVSCEQVEYDYQVSQRRFPQTSLAQQFASEYKMDNKHLEKDVILINFYYDSMTVLVVEETQKYTLLNVFRDFGGVLSLFLGMSVVSMGEAAYFFVFCIHILLKLVGKFLKL